jgi:coproporphyrinogen III oxidase-like Fe-S oxidoreductase
LGPTGTGYLAKSSTEAVRYKWKVSHAEVEIENLTKKELSLERLYLGLRTSDGFQLTQNLTCLVESWSQQKYVILEGQLIKLTSLGFLMLDSLMDDLFRYENQTKTR